MKMLPYTLHYSAKYSIFSLQKQFIHIRATKITNWPWLVTQLKKSMLAYFSFFAWVLTLPYLPTNQFIT